MKCSSPRKEAVAYGMPEFGDTTVTFRRTRRSGTFKGPKISSKLGLLR